MQKVKKKPIRKCIACGVSREKNELIRVVKNKEGEVFLDKTGKANGRGAYICNSSSCLEKVIKSKALNRVFSSEISEEAYQSLVNSRIE